MSCLEWRPSAAIGTLRLRGEILARVRGFFASRGVLEVETPALSASATVDPNVHSLCVSSPAGRRYLHTSPEFLMKRLLAAGSGDIYQISKVFRAGESGRYHNPEFTLLEWYRTGFDYRRLMDEVDEVVRCLATPFRGLRKSQRLSYRHLFEHVIGIDPHRAALSDLVGAACSDGLIQEHAANLERDELLDLLFAERIAKSLPSDRLTYVHDFPASQASLAVIRDDNPSVAERFEVLWGPLEIANGFSELTDADEQGSRFEREQGLRRARGLEEVPVDRCLLAALQSGLPACAGVAVGIDRLLMRLTGAGHIRDVLSFDWSRA